MTIARVPAYGDLARRADALANLVYVRALVPPQKGTVDMRHHEWLGNARSPRTAMQRVKAIAFIVNPKP
jgi:hypothetical protein